MPSVVGEITKGAVFDYIVDGVSVGSEGEAVSLVLVSQGDNTAAWAVVSIAGGGTGQATQQGAIDALTAVSGATNEHVLTKDTASGNAIFKAATGGGETNTASNQGTDGVGVYDTKAGVDLQFRHVAPGSAKITTALNGKDIDVDLGSVASTDLSDTANIARLNAANVFTDDDNTFNNVILNDQDGTPVADRELRCIDGMILAANTGEAEGQYISGDSVERASTAQRGCAVFNSAHFSVSSGAVSLSAAANTKTIAVHIEAPYAGQEFAIGYSADAITITSVYGITDTGSSTVTFNIEARSQTAPEAAGTNVMSSDVVADDDGQAGTLDGDPTIAADNWLFFASSAIAGPPAHLWLKVEYTTD